VENDQTTDLAVADEGTEEAAPVEVLAPGTPEYDAALAKMAEGNNQLAKFSNNLLDDMTKRGDYLPRLQLCGSNTDLVKDDKIKKGNYAYVTSKEAFIDLGCPLDIMPLCWRPLALDMMPKNPISVFDEKSALFLDIKERAKPGKNLKCTWGPQFLVWIPSIQKFAALHLGSATNRPCGTQLNDLKMKGATLTWKRCFNETHKWEGIVVNPCTTPFTIPDPKIMTAAIAKFNLEATAKAPVVADQKVAGNARER
jgi:hypothetical protein